MAMADKASPSVNAENDIDKKVGSDISKILATIKLPERREPPASEVKREFKKEPVTFDTALGAAAKPKQDAAAGVSAVNAPPVQNMMSAPPAPAPGKTDTGSADGVTRVHTFKDDMQEVVRGEKISFVRAAALEQEKRAEQKTRAQPEPAVRTPISRRTVVIYVIVVLLVLFGGIFLYSVYSFMKGGTTASTNAAPKKDTPLIFAENTIVSPFGALSAVDIKRSLAQIRQTNFTLGSITRITSTVSETDANGASHDRPAAINDFLQAIGAQATPDLIRAFSGNFFLGIHAIDKNAPFLIIPVSSYERAFAGMLTWEPTMNADLSPFFTSVPPYVTDANGLQVERKFQDAILYNYDVRVLRDDAGAVQLLYSFPTRSILIIAESPNSFSEILSRLRANRQL